MSREQDEAILTRFEESLLLAAMAPATVVNYLADLRAFLRWGRTELGDNFSLLQVTQLHIRRYRNHLAQELERTASTVNRHLMALRKFCVFAQQTGDMSFDPTAGVSLVQNDRQVASRALTGPEIDRLIQAAHHGARASLVRRDLAILQLLLHTGIRIGELVDLQKDDVIFDHPGVRLRVCGASQPETEARYLPLNNQVYKTLNEYLLIRPQATASDHLFLGQDGRPISNRTVQRIVTSCARAAGLTGVSAQSLRRTFALHLLAETDDLELVSVRLGHQNRIITEQYLSVHQNSTQALTQ